MYKVAILDDEKNFLEEIHNCLQEYEMFEVSYFQEAKLLIDEIDYFYVVYWLSRRCRATARRPNTATDSSPSGPSRARCRSRR